MIANQWVKPTQIPLTQSLLRCVFIRSAKFSSYRPSWQHVAKKLGNNALNVANSRWWRDLSQPPNICLYVCVCEAFEGRTMFANNTEKN